jgi:hypothetical protein
MSGRRADRRFPLAVLAVATLRCATIYSRGYVEDAAGAAIPAASVRLLDSDGRVVAADRTDANGCFFLQRGAPAKQRRFTLEIGAEGFKAAHLDVPLEPPILHVVLAPGSSAGESAIRATTPAERSDDWSPRCIPLYPGGGAQQLSPR